ncbi:MAG: sulfatase-like hydrolase/transferase, partial [Thermoproteus sp. AZ2]
VRNIALIVLDTLRWDYSGYFDWLSGLGFRKYSAWASSPWTLPSHVSMFTGLTPSEHGVHEPSRWIGWGWLQLVREKAKASMAKLGGGALGLLRDLGYYTIGISANPYISEAFGFKFDEYYDINVNYLQSGHIKLNDREVASIKAIFEEGATAKTVFKAFIENGPASSAKLLLKALELLARGVPSEKGVHIASDLVKRLSAEGPVFLFINLMEMHEPYTATDWARSGLAHLRALIYGSAPPRIIGTWRRRYPQQARFLSRALRGLLRGLRDFSIVVVSDHGQMLGEGGLLGHGYWLREELLRVPLWVKWGGKAPTLKEPASIADVAQILANLADERPIRQSPPIAEAYGPLISPAMRSYAPPIDAIKRLYGHRVKEAPIDSRAPSASL